MHIKKNIVVLILFSYTFPSEKNCCWSTILLAKDNVTAAKSVKRELRPVPLC